VIVRAFGATRRTFQPPFTPSYAECARTSSRST